jgi:hypothetical protein
MKHKFLTVVSFLFVKVLFAQYTQIPDPNFEQLLEDNGMGDGIEGNGQVLTVNIENVTELVISNSYGIQDLTGIEDFNSLETFGCSFNPVTNINLSQNVHLKVIGFLQMFSLDNIDLSMLSELEELYLSQNLFNSITFGNHPNLTYIDVSENSLTSLDVSQCPALTYLDVHENYISELDVSQNPDLEQLIIPLNPLSSLDTSQNPDLEVLWAGDVLITDFDFTQNPNLNFLNIGYMDELTTIDLRNGNNEALENVDIYICPNLECIFVDDTSAPYMEDWYLYGGGQFVNNEDECDALQTEDILAKRMLLFPNPVKDKLTIVNAGFKMSSVKITDISGRVILMQKADSEKIEIDFSGFPKGIYFVSAESENGANFKTEKIIKK